MYKKLRSRFVIGVAIGVGISFVLGFFIAFEFHVWHLPYVRYAFQEGLAPDIFIQDKLDASYAVFHGKINYISQKELVFAMNGVSVVAFFVPHSEIDPIHGVGISSLHVHDRIICVVKLVRNKYIVVFLKQLQTTVHLASVYKRV